MKTGAALIALLCLAACGGGSDTVPEAGVAQFAAQMRALGAAPAPLNATVATDSTVTADMVLDWAQYKFPDLFPKIAAVSFPAVVYEGVVYNARAYGGAWGTRYLGVTPDGRIFGLGDFTGQLLQQFDTIGFWAAQVLADQCAVNPGSCSGTNQPAGPFNNCALPATQALRTGNRLVATYALSGSSSGEFTLDALVQGPGSFNGQAAVRQFTRIQATTTAQGVSGTATTESTSFEQDAGGGFTRVLGIEANTTIAATTLPGVGSLPATVTSSRTVFNPASVNVEMSIQPGQSITKSVTTSSTSTTNGVASPATSLTTANTHTFVRREAITVRGRSYSTCRYSVSGTAGSGASTTTTTWTIDGLGVAVRTETVSAVLGQTQTEITELVSGSFNGAPL
jgi:hypothetical protein